MAKKYAVIESMFTCQILAGNLSIPKFTVRVWREEDQVKDCYDQKDLSSACVNYELRVITENDFQPSNAELAEILIQLPRVNAVEVKDERGMGIVLYREWP